MDSGRVRMALYVRAAVKLRNTSENPPPLEPPTALKLRNRGLWRVVARWWRDHQPDAGGKVCRLCFRWWPCPGVISADRILDTIWRRATAKGGARVPTLYPRNRNV